MTEYLDRYPTMHEYAEGKRINPKLTDLISRADAIEAVCKAVCEDDVSIFPECDQIKYCDEIQALLALPSADITETETCQKCQETTERVLNRQGDGIKRLKASAEAVQGDGKMIPIELKKRYPHSRDEDITDAFMRGYQAHGEAVQGWIPCSERLPEDSGNYLITVADLRLGHNGEHTVTMADFYAEAKKWNSVVDVYAWMPLPKPWKGADDED